MNKNPSNGERRGGQLPGWLWPNSNILPQFYKQVWEAVRDDKPSSKASLQREHLVDTNKIFPLLLTSQLPTDILGYIWSLANKKYAGQLTEQELYIVLALVALAQASYPFNSLQVLNFIRVPPIPTINVDLINQVKMNSPAEPQVNFQEPPKKYQPSSAPRQNQPAHGYYEGNTDVKVISNSRRHRVTTSEPKPYASSSSTDSGDEFSEFQSAPVPVVANKTILDTKHGSAIGSRLANHNLGSKKILEKTKKSNTVKSSTIQASYCCPSTREELFSKCTVKGQTKMTVILKDTVIRNNETTSVSNDTVTTQCEPEFKDYDEFGNFVSAESVPSSFAPVAGNHQDLMNLQPMEDKYSALRALVEDPAPAAVPQSELLLVNKPPQEPVEATEDVESTTCDDFGDFVSAEQPENPTDFDLQNVDLLADFDFNHYESSSKSDPSLMQEISEAFNALGLESSGIQNQLLSEEKLETLEDSDKVVKNVIKEDTISVSSIEIGNNLPEHLPRSASVPSLDLKSFFVSSQDDDQSAENMHQLIYSEWKQYMESCVLLLQVAANIFTNITSETVLREVLASAQGYNFLCNLAEVAAVCRRVNFSHKEMDINIMGFDDLLMDIDKMWAVMEPFYADIPIVSELPIWPTQSDNITCALCLTVITSDGVVHNDNNYHLTCANLWLNCVNSNLPVLRYPSNH